MEKMDDMENDMVKVGHYMEKLDDMEKMEELCVIDLPYLIPILDH